MEWLKQLQLLDSECDVIEEKIEALKRKFQDVDERLVSVVGRVVGGVVVVVVGGVIGGVVGGVVGGVFGGIVGGG